MKPRCSVGCNGFLLAALPIAFAGCRTWDEVRSDFIEPINEFLHQRHAKAWVTMNLDELLSLYSEELARDENFRRLKENTLVRFTNIEHAVSIIEAIERQGRDDRVRSRILLRLRGQAPGERWLAMEQLYEMQCQRGADGAWRIVAESLLDEKLAGSEAKEFSEEAEVRGLAFRHRSRGVPDKHGRVQDYTPGSGLAVGDYDGDGHDDVFLVGGDEARLFRNRGDGTFLDVTQESGTVMPPAGEGRCAVFSDYDNDGRLDLFVGRIDAPNLLYRNLGGDRFEEVGARAGIVPESRIFETTGACFADFNSDGHLDLYVVNGGNLLRIHPEPMHHALNANPNFLYMSNGDGTFTDLTAEAGVGHTGFGLAVAAADYDIDGDVDIFVGNDVGFNVLYRNRGDGRFDDVTLQAGISYRGTTMSAAWGDVNGDGYPDLFAAAMDSNSRWMVDQPGFPAPAPWFINLFLRRRVLDILAEMFYGNRLYLNGGNGTFREVSTLAGVRRNGWAWSTLFLDYDNDGLLDVYGVNGFISGQESKDL